MRRTGAAIGFAALLLLGCSDTDDVRREAASAESSVPGAPSTDVQRRLAQLEAFEPDPTLAGQQCGDLSVSNGSVQLDATGSSLARAIQTNQPVPQSDLHLIARFGSGFPSLTCTDLESEVHRATVEESWPASATSATFTVVTAEQCSSATLQLVGVAVFAPDGQIAQLGEISITNPAWQWWPPFECHLVDHPPAD